MPQAFQSRLRRVPLDRATPHRRACAASARPVDDESDLQHGSRLDAGGCTLSVRGVAHAVQDTVYLVIWNFPSFIDCGAACRLLLLVGLSACSVTRCF